MLPYLQVRQGEGCGPSLRNVPGLCVNTVSVVMALFIRYNHNRIIYCQMRLFH